MKPKDLLDDLEAGDRTAEHLDPKEPEGPTASDFQDAVRYVTSSGPATYGTLSGGGAGGYITYTTMQTQMAQAQQQNVYNQAQQLTSTFQQAYGQSLANLAGGVNFLESYR